MNQTKNLFSGLLIFTTMVLLVLSGCSGSSTPSVAVPGGVLTTTSSSAQTKNQPTSTAVPLTTPLSAQTIVIDLVAQQMAFDKSDITVPAGAQVTINFNNKDGGIPHNFAAYTDQSAKTPIFIGKIISGPATETYIFTAPAKPGTYFFRCDPHPIKMTGRLIVQ
jgi:plastocyanin